MNVAETEYAWAAGIIDGEGTILMTRAKPGVNRRVTLGFQIRISVRMTHKETIEKLHYLFGGTLNHSSARDLDKHKPAYGWYVGDLKTEEVLRRVLPYMITKHAQALLVLEFRNKCFSNNLNKRVDDGLAALRLDYFEQLKMLNRKGPNREVNL